MKIELLPPLTKIVINQPFGMNYVDFYKKLGLKGHNGIDYRAKNGEPCYAAHGGTVIGAGEDGGGGIGIEVVSSQRGEGFKTIYYHLKSCLVKIGDTVIGGQLIGYCDNTGQYTTGDHLHFGLKKTIDGVTQDINNGYSGAIDPAPYFPQNYDKSRAYHRYGRERNWLAEYYLRFAPNNIKNRWTEAGHYIQSVAKRLYFSLPISGEMTNALIYGGWDLDAVINPAMTQIWQWYKKEEYLKIWQKN